MGGLYYLVPTLFVILVSYLIVRAGAVALVLTGLDWERSRFQALSAFTGTGFTTREAELVLNNPVRRKIVSWLMILGNAGIVTVIVTATSSLVTSRGYQISLNFILLATGILLIHRIAGGRGYAGRWENFVRRKLQGRPEFEKGATEELLYFFEGFGLVKIRLREGSPIVGRRLQDLRLKRQGLIVLGIKRGRGWIQSPLGGERLKKNDRVVVYGALAELKKLGTA